MKFDVKVKIILWPFLIGVNRSRRLTNLHLLFITKCRCLSLHRCGCPREALTTFLLY